MIGTAIDRNTMVRITSDSPTTRIPKGSSAPPSRSDTSICTAVAPVTARSTWYVSRKCWCFARMSATSWAVVGESGAVVGMTWMMPVSAVAFGVATGTAATPGIAAISSPIFVIRPTGSVLDTIEPVTMSGPL